MRITFPFLPLIACIGLAVLGVIGTSDSKAVDPRFPLEVMLVEDLRSGPNGNLGARLSAEGISVLEDYGSFALASVTVEQMSS